jgi:hypothetical protein
MQMTQMMMTTTTALCHSVRTALPRYHTATRRMADNWVRLSNEMSPDLGGRIRDQWQFFVSLLGENKSLCIVGGPMQSRKLLAG